MIRNLPACTALFFCIVFASPSASASPPEQVHLDRQGSVDLPTLVHRLGLDPGTTLKPTTALKTMQGTVKQRYQQKYRGVPVFGCSVTIERNAKDEVLDVDGRVARNLGTQMPSVKPSISPAQAVNILRRKLGLVSNVPVRQVEHTLYIDPRGNTPRLAYHVSFFTPGRLRPEHPTALIDARDGHVIDLWRGLTTQSGALVAHPASHGTKAAPMPRPGSGHD